MCGRYALRSPLARVAEAFAASFDLGGGVDDRPRYNVAPSQHAPVVRVDADGARRLTAVRWGLIPSWTKGKPKLAPINAKCETAATGAMFRQAMERRRCLVPADGFYEWQGTAAPKRPHFIHMKDDGLFAFAGLWERWRPEPDAEPVDTFTVITTSPNAVMAPIHNRMPVIVASEDHARWLDRAVPATGVADVLRPYDAGAMDAHAVSTRVNNVRHDGPELVVPDPPD